jgi:hypothetical protein
MEPAEYKRLQELAEREGLSVAELVRRAVTERYFLPAGQERKQNPVPVGDWDAMKRELSERYGAHLP